MMNETWIDLRRSVTVPPIHSEEALYRQEWLLTNGLGGYASGTIGGVPTRRYHGLLIAALPNPAARVMMLNSLAETLRFSDYQRADLGWVPPTFTTGKRIELVDFHLELGLPIWRYQGAGIVLERRLFFAYGHNTTILIYRLLEGGPLRLELRPALQFRGHDDPVSTKLPAAYPLYAFGERVELDAPDPFPNLRFHLIATRSSFVIEPIVVPDLMYATEERRGYASRGKLYSPGRFRAEIAINSEIAFVASTEEWDTLFTMTPDEVLQTELERRQRLLDMAACTTRISKGPIAELVLAADQFIIRPEGRHDDHVRARIAGDDEAWTIIAGYHWFTDWGRDSMISLEGLCLATGRHEKAGSILRMFAYHMKDGLIPNLFPEGANEGLYHTADATLWFFHAVDRYFRVTHDQRTLASLLPKLRASIDFHIRGTRFGIHVDSNDGLLHQGATGYQLTWMDAKAGDWVVTPRRGKAVEINALWYNALRLMEGWLQEAGDSEGSAQMRSYAEQVFASFTQKFWNHDVRHLYDVIDGELGDDLACRPNQLFAISLPHPVLAQEHWEDVLTTVERELLTPVGLRSLSRSHQDYKPNYHGDLLTRDAAYHQGTVWSWLIGPYIDAYLRVHPQDRVGARKALDGLIANLGEDGIGAISEVFDAEPPYTPRGCIAQAWGVAELLRCLLLTEQ